MLKLKDKIKKSIILTMKIFILIIILLFNIINKIISYTLSITNENNTYLGTIEFNKWNEPIDIIEEYREKYNLSINYRNEIYKKVCKNIKCLRSKPLLFNTRINDKNNNYIGTLSIFEKDEPIDIIYKFSLTYPLFDFNNNYSTLLNIICKKIQCKRTIPIIFSQRIYLDTNKYIGLLNIYYNEEPIDSIHTFCIKYNVSLTIRDQLFNNICKKLNNCKRKNPLLLSSTIHNEFNKEIGILNIYEGMEPVDAIYSFGTYYNLTYNERRSIVLNICNNNNEQYKFIQCKRMNPIILKSPIIHENIHLGILIVYENQELVDAIYDFGQKYNISYDTRLLILKDLCGSQTIQCTRANALIYDTSLVIPMKRNTEIDQTKSSNETINDEIQKDTEIIDKKITIQIFEGQEPADIVYNLAKEYNLNRYFMLNIIEQICNQMKNRYICKRMKPIIYSVPIKNTTGHYLGHIHIQYEQEPIDAIAPFCEENNLNKEERKSILYGICEASGIPCYRDKSILFTTKIKDPIQYDAILNKTIETFTTIHILEEEEPIDLLYHYAKEKNLSIYDRQNLLINLCHTGKEYINCTRAEPLLFKIPVQESEHKLVGTLEIFEDQEPIDVVYTFLEKHDLLQSPANTSLIKAACESAKVICNRTNPRRTLFTLKATFGNIPHTIYYVKPENDWICTENNDNYKGKNCLHNIEIQSKKFCFKYMPHWDSCVEKVMNALQTQLDMYEAEVWKGKDLYAKLGLVRTATDEEIINAYNKLVVKYNNETEPEKYTKLQEAYKTLSDPNDKYYYDLPCMKFFGLCGKKKPDGSISITPEN